MSEDDEKPRLDAALRHLAEQKRRSLTSHPTPQELAAYHAGELPPEAEARLLDHLAICRDCSDLLLDLAGFADLKPPQGIPELTDKQVEQDWQAIRSRMREGEGRKETKERTAEVVPIRPAGPMPKPERSYWLPIAASLLAVLGLSFGLYQSTRVGQPWSPATVPLSDEVQRSGEGEAIEQITSEDGAILLFYFDPDKIFPLYEVEIVGRTNVKVAPPKEGDRPISLLIPRDFLRAGTYLLRLYGLKDGQRAAEVGEYQIQVDDP